RRDHGRIGVLAGAAGADEAVLRALVAFDLGVLERRPVGALLAEAADIPLHDLFDRHAFELGRTRMAGNAHGALPVTFCWTENRLVMFAASTTVLVSRTSERQRATIRDPACFEQPGSGVPGLASLARDTSGEVRTIPR